ncbi:MAG TPA: 6-carboxytetrahydropterin synthase QueD [Flexistipes sinusarabici]|uniref:6-carboxy-5,6,7,8-tetrahydropterin synthase n=1 Tax=Flexistipes sinusarabici TaxID=2352 RepID=A0A3D5QB81_FLESI|nr:6-carboxytetrahydropterin synthase QueD [Flexistipes sinusarabici]
MYKVKVTDNFSSAHNLREYEGNCEKLHGHNWQIEVSLKGEELDELGMLVDFRELKKEVKNILNTLDHTYLNDHEYFSRVNPTSENIAHFIYKKLKSRFKDRMDSVTVWESNDSATEYYE